MLNRLHQFQSKKWIRTVADSCFYLGLLIELAIVLLDKSFFVNPIEGRLFQITFCLFFLKMLLTEFDFKEYIIIFVMCLLGLFVDRLADRNEILRMTVFVFSIKNVDFKKAMKFTLWITTIGCAVIMLLSVTGIYGSLKVAKEYQGVGDVYRFAFGMGNANAFHCMFFVLLLLALYLYYEKINWWVYVVLFVLNVCIYLLTDSRTGMLITALSILLFAHMKLLVRKKRTRILKWLSLASVLSYIGMIGLSVYFAYDTWKIFYKRWSLPGAPEKSIIYILDRALTGRISTLSATEGWKGAMVSWTWLPDKAHTDYFDLGYVRLFYWYGIIAAVLILGIFLLLEIYLCTKKNYAELLFLTMISIYTLMEAHFVSVYIGRCYPLFILGAFGFELFKKDWLKD